MPVDFTWFRESKAPGAPDFRRQPTHSGNAVAYFQKMSRNEESDWTALASDEVRLETSSSLQRWPEPQTTSAVPQPTDNTHGGSHHLVEVRKKLGSSDTRSQKDIPFTEFFNTHRRLHSQRCFWRKGDFTPTIAESRSGPSVRPSEQKGQRVYN